MLWSLYRPVLNQKKRNFYQYVHVLPLGETTSGFCGGMVDSWLVRSSPKQLSIMALCPGQGHSVVFLGKTLCPHSASRHQGMQMGTSKLNTESKPVMDQHPNQLREEYK